MSTALATTDARPAGVQRVPDIVRNLDEMWNLAEILVRSRMLPSSIGSPEAAVAIMLKGRELGIGSMAAFAGITVIQGKPVVSPQLMLSLINRSGVLDDLKIEDDGERCVVTMKRRGKSPISASFSMANAREMQLAGKDNWKKMPAVMRQWRAVAACARIACPDVIDGLYTPEELGAEVTEDGEIIHGEVVAAYRAEPEAPQAPPPAIENASGHGHGKYASPEQVGGFLDWLDTFVDRANRQWAQKWDEACGEAIGEGHAVPTQIRPLLNIFQAKNHLIKWAIEAERLDPSIVPEDIKGTQPEKFLAVVFYRDKDNCVAVQAEMKDYARKQGQVRSDAIYRDFPHLAPEGWAEEQAELADDADEAPVPAPAPKRKTKRELSAALAAPAPVTGSDNPESGDEAPWEGGRE